MPINTIGIQNRGGRGPAEDFLTNCLICAKLMAYLCFVKSGLLAAARALAHSNTLETKK
jgi:hypothetical protein